MSIWNEEIIRANGDLKVYVGIQNDFTGNILYQVRNIYLDGDEYYYRADGMRHNVTKMRNDFLMREQTIQTALEWYRKTKF